MRPQDFLSGKLKDVKFRISLPGELVTTQEEVDNYAIDFANWFVLRYTEAVFYRENYTEDLLEEFKKEKVL